MARTSQKTRKRSARKSTHRKSKRSTRKSTHRRPKRERLPDINTSAPRVERDYSMMVLVAVAVVAIIALYLSTGADLTGEAYNIPQNMCDQYCEAGYRGVPAGGHGNVYYCRCLPDMSHVR